MVSNGEPPSAVPHSAQAPTYGTGRTVGRAGGDAPPLPGSPQFEELRAENARRHQERVLCLARKTIGAIGGLQSPLFSRVRLQLLLYLAAAGPTSFSELWVVLEEKPGNVAAHLRRLEAAAYVTLERGFQGRRPKTTYHLTDRGSEELRAFTAAMLDGWRLRAVVTEDADRSSPRKDPT